MRQRRSSQKEPKHRGKNQSDGDSKNAFTAKRSTANRHLDFVTNAIIIVSTLGYLVFWHIALVWWRENATADMPHLRPDAKLWTTQELLDMSPVGRNQATGGMPRQSIQTERFPEPPSQESRKTPSPHLQQPPGEGSVGGGAGDERYSRSTTWQKSGSEPCVPPAVNSPSPKKLAKMFMSKLKRRRVDVNGLNCLVSTHSRDFALLLREGSLHDVLKTVLDLNRMMQDIPPLTTIRDRYAFPDLWMLVELLVQHGCNVNMDLGFGLTPLHVVARFRQLKLMKVLLTAGADPDRKDNWGDTPAAYTLATTSEQIIVVSRMLLDKSGASGSIGSQEVLCGPIPYSEFVELSPRADKLFNKRRVVLDQISLTEIRRAVFEWDMHILKVLVTRKGLEARNSQFGWSLAHRVASHGNVEALELFRKFGSELFSAEDSLGRLPVHIAGIRGQKNVVTYLTKADSSMSRRLDKFGSRNASYLMRGYPNALRKKHKYKKTKQATSGNWNTWEATDLNMKTCDITQVSKKITMEEIVSNFLIVGQPVMVRGGASAWMQQSDWTRDAIIKHHGHIEVHVGQIPFPEYFTGSAKKTTLKEFIMSHNEGWWKDNYHTIIQQFGSPFIMYTDRADKILEVPMKDFPLEGSHLSTNETDFLWERHTAFVNRKPFEVDLGPPLSGAPPTYALDKWNALFFGKRRWFLWPQKDAVFSSLPAYSIHKGGLAGLAEPLQCIQEPGDVLYIPELWASMNINLKESVGITRECGMNYLAL